MALRDTMRANASHLLAKRFHKDVIAADAALAAP